MLKKAAGIASILYFIYASYIAISSSGFYAIIGLIYFLPYLLAGIFLLKDEQKTLTILSAIAILIIPLHTGGYSLSQIARNLINPIYLIFSVILPAAIIYSALKE